MVNLIIAFIHVLHYHFLLIDILSSFVRVSLCTLFKVVFIIGRFLSNYFHVTPLMWDWIASWLHNCQEQASMLRIWTTITCKSFRPKGYTRLTYFRIIGCTTKNEWVQGKCLHEFQLVFSSKCLFCHFSYEFASM